MEAQETIAFDRREATVLVDVLEWAADVEDLSDRAADQVLDYTDAEFSAARDRLADDGELDPSLVSPREVGGLLQLYADALEEQAWDIEDSQSVFAFYETTFQRIESQLEQHTTG